MDDTFGFPLVAALSAAAGVHFMVLGAFQLARRPRVLRSWVAYLPLFLMIVPFAAIAVAFRDRFAADPGAALLAVAASALAIAALIALYVVRGGQYILLNTTYDLLTDGLRSAFDSQRIRYKLTRVDAGLDGLSRRFVRFDIFTGGSAPSLAVILNLAQKSATLKVLDRRFVAAHPALIPALKRYLEARRLDGVPTGGIMQLFGSIILLALSFYILA